MWEIQPEDPPAWCVLLRKSCLTTFSHCYSDLWLCSGSPDALHVTAVIMSAAGHAV